MLNPGDTILAGTAFGRVRAMIDELGKMLNKQEPLFQLRLSDYPMSQMLVMSLLLLMMRKKPVKLRYLDKVSTVM